jgi:transcriptional regulator with XRE-family HTH domain
MPIEKNQEFLVAFGKRVAALRKEKGMSMRGLADTLNIDHHQLSRIENAQINTSILMAHRLAEALEVPISVLFDL